VDAPDGVDLDRNVDMEMDGENEKDEAAGHISDVDVEQQLLSKSAGGDSVPDVPLPYVPLPDVPLHEVSLPEARPYTSVGEE